MKLALRIDARLRADLNEGIDARRMVAEPVYARDVLLVCEALVGSDLPALAGAFREAAAPETVSPLMRAPLGIANLLSAIFGKAEPRAGSRSSGRGPAPRRPRSDAARRSGTPPDGR